jgi:5'(3')-deoxyribonucleotidase
MKPNTPVVFLDMDGVITDFVRGCFRHHNHSENEILHHGVVEWDVHKQLGIEDTNVFWEDKGFDFWANLEWCPEGKELVKGLESMFGDNICIISSPCYTQGCIEGKRAWIKENLPQYQKKVLFGSCKEFLAGPRRILVDDHDHNLNKFKASGGLACPIPRPWNSYKNHCDATGTYQTKEVFDWLHNWTKGSKLWG